MFFQGESSECCKPSTEACSQQKGLVFGKEIIFKREPDDNTYEQATDNIDQKST